MSETREDIDPDIREVFAELARQDAALEASLGLEAVEPMQPPPAIESLEIPHPDASPEEWRKNAAEARDYKAPDMTAARRAFEASLVRMKKSLEVPSGSDALDAANKRVYAAHVALFESSVGVDSTPSDFARSSAVMRESMRAGNAAWLLRLELLLTTSNSAMRPKVQKAIDWQETLTAKHDVLLDKAERAMDEVRRSRDQRSDG